MIADEFVRRSREILVDKLTGIYLHGSAAMGCHNPEKSDLDRIVVTKDSPDDTDKRAYMDMVAELDARMPGKDPGHSGIEMSMVLGKYCNPFVYPTPFELHFSAMHRGWYRQDPDDYIRKMKGTDKDLAVHFTVIRNRGRCLYGKPVEDVFGEVPEADWLDSVLEDAAGAREEIVRDTVYFTLNLARTAAYIVEGKTLSKKEGGEWGLQHLPEKYHPLLRAALRDYAGGDEVSCDPGLAEEYAEEMLRRIREKRI